MNNLIRMENLDDRKRGEVYPYHNSTDAIRKASLIRKQDLPSLDVFYVHTLIIGAPGTGYETFQKKKGSINISDSGFRSSSLLPGQWFVSLDVLFGKMIYIKESKVFSGYCQNWPSIIHLPWRQVYCVNMSESILRDRVETYRNENKLTLNEKNLEDDQIRHFIENQRRLVALVELLNTGLKNKIEFVSDYDLRKEKPSFKKVY